MYTRQIAINDYDRVCAVIKRKAHFTPLQAACEYDMAVNGVRYRVQFLFTRERRITALQAVRLDGRSSGELVVDTNVLKSLTEMLLAQLIYGDILGRRDI